MTAQIVARNWGWHYASRLRPAVADLSFSFEPGEFILLAGDSGSGKSTLCLALAGLLSPDQGEATGTLTVDGADARALAGRIGYVMQDSENQIIGHRVADDVAFGCESWGVEPEEISRRVAWALSVVGLGALSQEASTAQLSGGQQQRLSIAGVLAMKPEVIVLDEPTANLDAQGATDVVAAIRELRAEYSPTIILVDHNQEQWAELIDRTIQLVTAPELQAGNAALRPPPPPPPPSPTSSPRNSEIVLEAKQLCFGYRPDHPCSSSFSDVIHPGEVLALTGVNGAGKTALTLTLAGLLAPISGEVTHKVRPGLVFQNPAHQFLKNTVRDELMLSARLAKLPRALAAQRVDELLARVGLAELARAHPLSLSGGQQRRLSVATMLVGSPRVLILDEPSYGQDDANWLRLVELLGELRASGVALIIATHDERLITALGARRVELAS